MTSDTLSSLPTDKDLIPTPDELATVTQIFGEIKNPVVYNHYLPAIIGALLFFVLSLPLIDNIINTYIKNKSSYILLIVKSVIFLFVFYFISNWKLSRG